ncbi:lytic transglycosylase domain-containing protein [Cupriavidus sp. 2TAF22]|uniref:lytic transglycosylase domain-containing protein n=1 Tax=unclassified Cupriavidus TaxID=2640874 RepID=UPI003F8F7906
MSPIIKILISFSIGQTGYGYSGAGYAADIYRSEGPDGEVRFASQPLDKSYRLYLRGETPRAAVPGKAVASRAGARPDNGSAPAGLRDLPLAALVEQLSAKHAVDAALVKAVIEVESRGNPAAVSAKGATGVMQLLPSTAAMYGVTELSDPAQNIEAGVRHLKYLLDLHGGNVALALAAYNAGEGAVARHARRIPPYRETMLYVPAVLARMQSSRNQAKP